MFKKEEKLVKDNGSYSVMIKSLLSLGKTERKDVNDLVFLCWLVFFCTTIFWVVDQFAM